MQIHSIHRETGFLFSYRNATRKAKDPSIRNASGRTLENRPAGSNPSEPSRAPSARATGIAAPQKITETAISQGPQLDLKNQQIVQGLKKRDREVRSHEAAHLAAAGPYASGGPSYTYKRGPDGRQYAVGGEVKIDTSEVPNDPEATIRKAQVVRRAANAPAKPSAQDRRVAGQAAAMEAEARKALAHERIEENKSSAQSAASEESAGPGLDEADSPAASDPELQPHTRNNFPATSSIHAIGSLLDLSA